MATVLTRHLTAKYRKAAEWFEDESEFGWVGYCPELDIEVLGPTQASVADAMQDRINEETERIKRPIDAALRAAIDAGWSVSATPPWP